MQEGYEVGVCYLCGTETKNVNEVGNHICGFCAKAEEMNKEEITDEDEFLKTICGHPINHRTKDGHCKFCDKLVGIVELKKCEMQHHCGHRRNGYCYYIHDCNGGEDHE